MNKNGGKTTLDTSVRMRKDINFKNIIRKNCNRLRGKSSDDVIISRKIQEPNLERVTKKINYDRINKNHLLDSPSNITIDLDSNLMKQNNIKRKFFLDFNFDKSEPQSNAETERSRENITINNNINKIKIIKVNQKKNININCNYQGNIKRKENKNENKYLRQNTKEIKFYNKDIKQLISNLKENHINNKSKPNWKRSNSIRKIMNSLYYNYYKTETENNLLEEKQKLTEKVKRLNINAKNNYYKIKENIPNKKKILVKNKNSIFPKENNINIIKIKSDSKTDENNETHINKTFVKKKNKYGNLLNSNKDLYTFSTEENSFLTTDENKETIKNSQFQQGFIKVKMVYHKPIKKLNLNEKLENNSNSINDLMKSPRPLKANPNNHENKTNYNQSKGNKIVKLNNIISPRLKYKQKSQLNFQNKEADIINRNYMTNNKYENKNVNYRYNNIEKNFEKNIESKGQEKENFIIQFFNDIIELCNGLKQKTIFEILIKKINKKYFIDYNNNSFETNLTDIKDNFNYCFKYFCIILICFCFLSKENDLYKANIEKIHILYIQYIYSSLCLLGYQDLNTKSIKRFLKDYNLYKKVSIINCTDSIIKLLFDETEVYNSLNKILKQLMIKVRSTTIKDIIKIINETILFCFNHARHNKHYINGFQNNKLYNNYLNHEEENNRNKKLPSVPYIKTNMRKNFCLVLDLDETISHSLKLNFGNYFFLRPGTIEFLNELSKFYEIIIFTSSPKEYADDILDKIDSNGNLISHRLYKSHVIFEKGKSVKKLELIGRDLNKIIFVDNLKYNAKYNLKNLYLIPSWTDDINDAELYKLKNKLKYIYESGKFNDDVTKGL